MKVSCMMKSLARLLGTSLLVTPAFSAGLMSAQAHGRFAAFPRAKPPHILMKDDFFRSRLTNDDDAINAENDLRGHTYTTTILLQKDGDNTSFDASNFSGYNAITFGIGAYSSSDVDDTTRVDVLGDGHVLASIQPTSATVRTYGTIPLQGHRIITLKRRHAANLEGDWLVLTDPTLLQVGAPPPAAPVIVLATATSQSGSQQTVDVTTQAGRQVTIVIVYANGTHQIFGPQHAGPTGHDIYTFTVPQGTGGMAEVVAIVTGIGVARMTFKVS